jgi:N-acetylglucosaminyldiphosphoundecaprenol N-acetyl-beta-D-mannosaminyltransferase
VQFGIRAYRAAGRYLYAWLMATGDEAAPNAKRWPTKYQVGPVGFSVIPIQEAVRLVTSLGCTSEASRGVAVHFANAYNIALADSDPDYRQVLNSADLVFTDGTPVVWAGRRFHTEVASRWTRVYGPDVMEAVLAASTADGPRHYLLGGSPETLERLTAEISHRWPNAVIAGSESPAFRAPTAEELAERDSRILECDATLVWVGLGTPKQDYEVARLVKSIPVTALAVGAAFDFLAGTAKQAPVWMQRSGTEWLYRFSQEPKRLAHRYLWGNPRFITAALRYRGNS